MATSLAEKIKKIREDLKTPPKLSTVEQEKITATFEAMKEVLDDTLKIVMEKDRAEAFRYTNLMVTAIQQADTNFIGGVKANEINEDDPELLHNELGPVPKPDFKALLEALTPKQMNVAMRLDCVKQFQEEDGVGDEIICADCSMEKLIACIRIEDPTIDPNDDFKLDLENDSK